jgi:hypothetical protein
MCHSRNESSSGTQKRVATMIDREKHEQAGARLTLEIDGQRISAEKFARGVRAFLTLIEAVGKNVSGQPRGIRWLVEVRPGSANIDFIPEAVKVTDDTLPRVLDEIILGVAHIESHAERPPNFSNSALRGVRELASILDGKEGELDQVRIWRNGKPSKVTPRSIANVDSLLGTSSKDWGTIEGRLSVLSERRGLRFAVYDPVTDKPTRCHFDEEIISEVVKAFGKRVSVCGLIRYRGDGEPLSIRVEEFHVFPERDGLPSVEDVRGILRRSD